MFCSFVTINLIVDENNLNVDRWSALHTFIVSVLDGVYPYNIPDHLNQTSSNFPALFYLGLPFYFLGDVGFLQCFVFLIIVLWLFKGNAENSTKLIF